MKSVAGLVQGLAGVTRTVVDERLRTLYVTGRPEQFLEVEKVLQQVDHPGRQVMLQARIVEVTDNGKDELETIIDAVYSQWWFNYSKAGAGAGYVYADKPGSYNPLGGDNRPSPLRPITTDGLKKIAGGELTKMLDFGIRALVTKNKGKVLADPSIITMDGKKAVIKLVENYPYISERDEAGNPTWSEKEVGPILEFTPIVGRDGMVTIDLRIETGEIIGTYHGQAGEQFPRPPTGRSPPISGCATANPSWLAASIKTRILLSSTGFPFWVTFPCWANFSSTSRIQGTRPKSQ